MNARDLPERPKLRPLTNADVDKLLAELLALPKRQRTAELRRRYVAGELGGWSVRDLLVRFGERYLLTAPRTREEERKA